MKDPTYYPEHKWENWAIVQYWVSVSISEDWKIIGAHVPNGIEWVNRRSREYIIEYLAAAKAFVEGMTDHDVEHHAGIQKEAKQELSKD